MKERKINVRGKARVKERGGSNGRRQGRKCGRRKILLMCGPEFLSSASPFNLPSNAQVIRNLHPSLCDTPPGIFECLTGPLIRIGPICVSNGSLVDHDLLYYTYLNIIPWRFTSPPRPHSLISPMMFLVHSSCEMVAGTVLSFSIRKLNLTSPPGLLRQTLFFSPRAKRPDIVSQAIRASSLAWSLFDHFCPVLKHLADTDVAPRATTRKVKKRMMEVRVKRD